MELVPIFRTGRDCMGDKHGRRQLKGENRGRAEAPTWPEPISRVRLETLSTSAAITSSAEHSCFGLKHANWHRHCARQWTRRAHKSLLISYVMRPLLWTIQLKTQYLPNRLHLASSLIEKSISMSFSPRSSTKHISIPTLPIMAHSCWTLAVLPMRLHSSSTCNMNFAKIARIVQVRSNWHDLKLEIRSFFCFLFALLLREKYE